MSAEEFNGRLAEAIPQASSMIESLRDIGYALETAIADVIDNSITAGAKEIKILSEVYCDNPYIAIVDDGHGMDEKELIEAMRPANNNPLASRESNDLGRFGLGMKSASFSQCRRLTVGSRKNDNTTVAIWDLDTVARLNQWVIHLPDDVSAIPALNELKSSGTIVVWQKLDRLLGEDLKTDEKRAAFINHRLAETERHLRLVFHRFMERAIPVRLYLNGRLLELLDPFAKAHPATIVDPEEVLPTHEGDILIQSYTLPHHKQMNADEWEDLAGTEGHLKNQGFYVYRGQRLIIHGTWFGMCRQAELTKLTRVRVDIPNTMDHIWKIDVKKSSAQVPRIVRERLKKVIERIQDGSKRTYHRRGQKLVDNERLPLWHRIRSEGEISYRLNSEHPIFVDLLSRLPSSLHRELENCLRIIGASLPVETLHADMAGTPEHVTSGGLDDAGLQQAVESTWKVLREQGSEPEKIISMMRDVDPFRSSWERAQVLIDSLIQTESNA